MTTALGSGMSGYGGYANLAAGTVAGIGSYVQATKAAKQAERAGDLEARFIRERGDFTTEQLRTNAVRALLDAAKRQELADIRADDIRRSVESVTSSIYASAAASGVEMEGSPLLAVAATAYEGERRAMFEILAGDLEAKNLTMEAHDLYAQAHTVEYDTKVGAIMAEYQGQLNAHNIKMEGIMKLGQSMGGSAQTFARGYQTSNPGTNNIGATVTPTRTIMGGRAGGGDQYG